MNGDRAFIISNMHTSQHLSYFAEAQMTRLLVQLAVNTVVANPCVMREVNRREYR